MILLRTFHKGCTTATLQRHLQHASRSCLSTTANVNPDYVIVGAGSAGCVMAARLAEAGHSVTVLEAGHSDRSGHFRDLFVHMPTALAWPMSSPRYNWGFLAEPEPALDNRRVTCPRGKGLGGSSSVNGMVYVRGHPEDFQKWEEMGATNWGYRHVLPYFKKAENWQGGSNTYRATDGPLHVKFGDNAANTPLFDLFIKAGGEAGYGTTDDYNAQRQEGFGSMPMTVFHSGPMKGLRCSTASAYLHPAIKAAADKLVVKTQVMTRKVLLGPDADNPQGQPRAVGVEYIDSNGKTHELKANKEVILSAGSIQTPQLLQVSGIGDASHLESIGVRPLVKNSNVGQNLQDHLELYFQQEVLTPISIAPIMSSYFKKLQLGLQWILTRTGLGATNHFESAAFLRSSSSKSYPDVQFHFLPVGVSYDGVSLADSKSGHSMQVHIGTCRSASRGHVKARTNSMADPPEIRFNYMSQEQDWEDMRNAIEVARQVMRQPSLEGIAGDEILPGKDAELNEYIREHAESAYHPCGSCKMGSDPNKDGAVVDSKGRVFGVSGLRVVDASIFPSITNGNLNAPVIMAAERIADLILGRCLPPIDFSDDSKPWEPPSLDFDREKPPAVP